MIMNYDLGNVREKCDKGDAFWENMDAEEVKMKFDILIEHFAEKKNLQALQELSHISEQWSTLTSRCCPHLALIAKRASMCGNAAASCERENSKIARYKDKLSSSMGMQSILLRFLQNLFMHIDGFENATKCWDFQDYSLGHFSFSLGTFCRFHR